MIHAARRVFVLGGLAALTGVLPGCALVSNAPLKDTRHPGPLRDPAAPIASQVDVTLDRLRGEWRVLSSAGALAPKRRFQVRALSDGGAVFVQDGRADLPATDLGQGRFGVLKQQYWVHWMDADATVALVGVLNAPAVWIMTRAAPPADRVNAAWEVFDWYGYNREWMRAPE
ncbi:lipocalin [Aliishimia ponticola]|uniref:Lipocalin n=1 Tax=Aliishimia ponticola TaxID=2499833 RepID=A0A4V3XKL0_9RHOB|nr:lipocalin family protein [Aliishimia ponticola]THH37373.1 lipocalin [Aliishimia ponticola]